MPEPVAPDKASRYQSLQARLATLRNRELELLLQFTPESSDVTNLRALISATEKACKDLETEDPRLRFLLSRPSSLASGTPGGQSSIGDPTTAFEESREVAQTAALEAKVSVLTNYLHEAQVRASTIRELEGSIVDLQRRRDLLENSHRMLSASLEQARLDEALGTTTLANINVVEEPTAAIRARAENLKTAGMVLFAGVFGSLGLAFGFELFLRGTLNRPADIQRHLRLPLFLTIPRLRGLPRRQRRLLKRRAAPTGGQGEAPTNGERPVPSLPAEAQPLRDYHEALRDRLIMHFQLNDLAHKPKLVGLTGVGRHAGVSMLAAGLAESLSETGDGNVLLVDMNPAQGPSVYPFHLGRPGCELTAALEQEHRESALIQQNLYLASANGQMNGRVGIIPRKFATLMPKMKASDYDYIIFDMPPVSQTSVTAKVAGLLDTVLLVVDAEHTSAERAKRSLALLAESRANVGTVLNRYRNYLPERLRTDV
jgi:Mrp family chromosome partitioning ATPase